MLLDELLSLLEKAISLIERGLRWLAPATREALRISWHFSRRPRTKKWAWVGARLGAMGGCGAVMVIALGYLYLEPTNPTTEQLFDVELQVPLKVYTQDGLEIGQFGERLSQPVEFDQIPQVMVDAVLSAEDDGFFSHSGVDYFALLRATVQLAVNRGRIRSGGGTITMQVARNYLLTREQTFVRKFREISLALQIEEDVDKETILALYLNGVFFGNRAYGISAAAEVYFDKPMSALTVEESALLAALPKAPSRLNPLRNPAAALVRRNWVLRRMHGLGWIEEEEYQRALRTQLGVRRHRDSLGLEANYAAEQARLEAVQMFGRRIYRGGYRLYTTVDSQLQAALLQAVRYGLDSYDRRHGWRTPENRREWLNDGLAQRIIRGELEAFSEYFRYEEDGTPIPPSPQAARIVEGLRDYPDYGWAVPAFILDVSLRRALAVDAQARLHVLTFTEDLRWAQPRLDLDRLGVAPSAMVDLVTTGDLVYLKVDEDIAQGSNVLENSTLVQLPEVESASVAMDVDSGAIQALVGGYSFARSQFNRVYQAKQQIGSVIKPLIYSAALDDFVTPASVVDDAPVVLQDTLLEGEWRPRNASGRFFGSTRVREALIQSRNLVTVRLLRQLGVDKAVRYLESVFGLPSRDLARDLTLGLGNASVTPLQVASAFSTLANGGYRIKPYIIDRIEDADGKVVWRYSPMLAGSDRAVRRVLGQTGLDDKPVPIKGSSEPAQQVMDPRIAYQISSMLSEAMVRGTAARAVETGRDDFAGKTGTTNDAMGTWFAAYNSDITHVTWVGHDTPQALGAHEYGGATALPVWIKLMELAGQDLPPSPLRRPRGLTAARINPVTGKRVSTEIYGSIFELFRDDRLPEASEVETQIVAIENIF